MKNPSPLLLFLSICVVCAGVLYWGAYSQAKRYATILPEIPVVGCRGETAKLYDECGSQMALFEHAKEVARAEGKTLLVSYGAEWCIWCHVFDAYVRGEHTEFTHTYSDWDDEERYTDTMLEKAKLDPAPQANQLEMFFRETFVLVHIESRYSDDGHAVLEITGADAQYYGGLPFIFSVNPQGGVAAVFDGSDFEKRRNFFSWFRGYDRTPLLNELARLNTEANGT